MLAVGPRRDLRALDVRWLRRQIALVGQEPVLYNVSIRQNARDWGRSDLATTVEGGREGGKGG